MITRKKSITIMCRNLTNYLVRIDNITNFVAANSINVTKKVII